MKKISSSLYTYIIFWIVIGLIVSISISYPLNVHLTNYHEEKLQSNYIDNYKSISDIVNDYQLYIDKNSITINDLDNFDFSNLTEYYSLFITDKIVPGRNMPNRFGNSGNMSKLLIFPIKVENSTVYLYLKPLENPVFNRNIITILTIALGFIVFLLITYLALRKKLKYIKKMDNGLSVIAGGCLSHNIPLEGEDELTNLANSINEMTASLKQKIDDDKENDAKQKTLISNMSHDLRTPLTSILGYLNIIEDKKYKTDEELESYIKISKEKSLQLQKLINHLFEYTKLTNSEININMQKINIETFINQYAASVDREINIISKCSETPLSLADIELMKRILDNLFDNIRKYAIDDTPVQIEISTDETISVKISNQTNEKLDDELKYIFDRMYVADSSRKNNASGLGLSIVNESMKIMGGQVRADFSNPVLSIILSFKFYK